MKTKSKIRSKVLQSRGRPSAFESRGAGGGKGGKEARGSGGKGVGELTVSKRRSRAEEVRRKTIGLELKNAHKRGAFRDERVGEKDSSLGEEDRLLWRLRREHSKRLGKRAKYNLEDGSEGEDGIFGEASVLTHGGTAIDDFEDEELFGDPDGDAEEEDRNEAEMGLQSAEAVEKLNFGGGFVKKDAAGEDEEGRPKTHAEVMAEIIAKSKFHRQERAQEKIELEKQTEKLDAQLKEITTDDNWKYRSISEAKSPEHLRDQRNRYADFDRAVAELANERREQAADRLKTPEELAREEKARLEALEKKRLRRMNGLDEDEDDDSNGENETTEKRPRRAGGDDMAGNFELEVDEEEDENDTGIDADREREDGGDEEEDDEDAEDDGEDVRSNGKASDPARKKKKVVFNLERGSPVEETGEEDGGSEEGPLVEEDDGNDDMIPFVFKSCPSDVKGLLALFRGRSPRQRQLVVERLIRSFAVHLNPPVHKPILKTLLEVLLLRLSSLAQSTRSGWTEIGRLLPRVYELGAMQPESVATWAKQELERTSGRLNRDGVEWDVLGMDGLSILRIITILFPCSDLRHPVVTPASILLGRVLAHATVDKERRISASGRIRAEETRSSPLPTVCTAESLQGLRLLLERGKLSPSPSAEPYLRSEETKAEGDVGPDAVWRAIFVAMGIGRRCLRASAQAENPALWATFRPFLKAVEQHQRLVPELEPFATEVLQEARELCARAERRPLELYRKETVAPKLLNPRFGDRLSRSMPGNDESYNDRVKRLKRKVRKEERGAGRELRRDASFVARVRQEEQERLDVGRQRKSNEVMAFLEKQEQTWKQQERKKRRKAGKW